MKKIIIAAIVAFVLFGVGIFGWAYYSAYQVGKFVAPVFRKTLKDVMTINYLYQIFDVQYDSTLNFKDSTNRDYLLLKKLQNDTLDNNEIELLKDAHWIKRYLDKYYSTEKALPSNLEVLKMKLPFMEDYFGNRYFFRIIGNNCYVGSAGSDKVWGIPTEEIQKLLLNDAPLVYRNGDDMIIRLRPKMLTTVDSLSL